MAGQFIIIDAQTLLVIMIMYCVGSDTWKHGRIRESEGDFNSGITKKSTEFGRFGTDVQCPRTAGQTLTGNRQWEITQLHCQQNWL